MIPFINIFHIIIAHDIQTIGKWLCNSLPQCGIQTILRILFLILSLCKKIIQSAP